MTLFLYNFWIVLLALSVRFHSIVRRSIQQLLRAALCCCRGSTNTINIYLRYPSAFLSAGRREDLTGDGNPI